MRAKIVSPLLIGVFLTLLVGTLLPGEYKAAIQRMLGASNQIQPIAHFVLFFLLGVMLSWLLRDRSPWLPLAICLLPAIGTEWLQHFSPQRHPRLSDVGVDMSGALVGWSLIQISRLVAGRAK